MSEELYNAVKAVQAALQNVSGIKQTFYGVPEGIAVSPTALVWLGSGRDENGPPDKRENHSTIIVELHVIRSNLPVDIDVAMPFADSIPNALLKVDSTTNQFLAGTVTSILTIRRSALRPFTYGTTKTLGFHFEMDIKILSSIT